MSQLYVDEIFGGTEASPTLQSKINDLELKKTTLSSGPNHAIGTNALSSIVNGENNIAIGENALLSNTGTGPTSGKNIAIGDNSMSNNITGNQNIAIGKDSLVNCNAGESNIAIGNQAMLGAASPLEGNDANIAIGNSALYSIDAYGSLNVSVGVNSGFNITNGNRNTFLGSSSGRIASPSMNGSTFVGHQSGESATGNFCTGVGYQAGFSGGEQGTYVGAEAGENSTGTYNVCIGSKAGTQLTTGDRNILIGRYAGANGDAPVHGIQTGSDNIVLQTGPASSASVLDTSENVFIGSGLGELSFGAATEGQNVVIGHDAGIEATNSVGKNVIIGKDAAKSADTCSQAVVIGVGAANSATKLGNSTIVGAFAGQEAGNATFSASAAFFGHLSGAISTGKQNTCIGYRAGSKLTTGDNNLLLGAYAGSVGDNPTGALDTGSNNIVLAAGDLDWSDINTNLSNSVVIGSSTQTAFYAGVNTITALSDARDKKDVKEISAGLDFIKELKPVDFIWDERKESGKRDIKDCGFLAQDLKEAEDKHGVADYLRLVDDRNPEKLLASYGRLLPVMVKAIQELSQELELLKSK